MDPHHPAVVPLAAAAGWDERIVGGKTAKLAHLAQAGFQVPAGFCITTSAYEQFLAEHHLSSFIKMELGRKPFAGMRWEEVWDAALRIRSVFLSKPLLPALADEIKGAAAQLGPSKALAVRSSAPGEDSAGRSFAGLHESVVGVRGTEALLHAVKQVWASLWSDAALLYRQELALDPLHSRMAVLVQELVDEDRSGVAFGRDPRDIQRDVAIVEAVPGPGSDLVDGAVDPDRWVLDRASGEILSWRPGVRETCPRDRQRPGRVPAPSLPQDPLLASGDLNDLHRMLHRVENLFGWPPDTEWTGRGERFTLLQARPITTLTAESDDGRSWYLSLRPKMSRLTTLAHRVAEELIPELEEMGDRFAAEQIESFDDQELANVIEERYSAVERWREIYYEEFIPFAHGVRQLGTYYNDAVRPEDPYEFVGLLSSEPMLATRRNQKLRAVAERVRTSPALQQALRRALSVQEKQAKDWSWRQIIQTPQTGSEGDQFIEEVEGLLADSLDVAYAGERLADRPDLLLQTILHMADAFPDDRFAHAETGSGAPSTRGEETIAALEQRLLEAVGEERREEARNIIAIGRLSWRLRDDDNLLVGRLESQLLRALDLAVTRLVAAGRLPGGTRAGIPASSTLVDALRAGEKGPIDLHQVLRPSAPAEASERQTPRAGERPRQLVGQPAAPGLASGSVRRVREARDLGLFRAGEVLVCDAIQPTMTHLVPLASAIVERRGGMLIHGAIIARELGIPCVNGIADAVDLLPNGELVTVDGYLGIVTVGPPEFGLESAIPPDQQSGTDSIAEGA